MELLLQILLRQYVNAELELACQGIVNFVTDLMQLSRSIISQSSTHTFG